MLKDWIRYYIYKNNHLLNRVLMIMLEKKIIQVVESSMNKVVTI